MSTNNAINGQLNILQQVFTKFNSPITSILKIPMSTTPVTGNATFLTSLTITPLSASSTLLFELCCSFSTSGGLTSVGFFLFNGTSLVASTVQSAAGCTNAPGTVYFRYPQISGSTSTATYNIYFAETNQTLSMAINQTSGGNSFNNSMYTTFFITEIL